MSESSPDDIMSWDDLIYVADLLQADGQRGFSILGGEPTLHPEFNQIVVYLLERGFNVNIFTSGVMSNRTLDQAAEFLMSVPPERLSFTCNVNDPGKTPSPLAEVESVKRFLRTFGHRTTLGFNIYRTDFDLEFLFDYINEFGTKKNLRIGVAHPIPGQNNLFISPDDLDYVIGRLFSYIPVFERMRVKPGLDCGFPLCRFKDEHLGWLYRYTGGRYDFGCAPVIDIGPDMTVWSCFPLGPYQKRSLFEFNSLREVFDHFGRLHNSVRSEVGGIFDECDDCGFREEQLCHGGCLAHSLSHFLDEAPVRMKEVYP